MMNEEQIRSYHLKVEDNIRKHGYHSTFVFSKNDPSFCYSTGLVKSFGIPEIFISSLPQNLAHTLVEKYAEKFKSGAPIPLNKKLKGVTDRFAVYQLKYPRLT
jgi:hypothetical protein